MAFESCLKKCLHYLVWNKRAWTTSTRFSCRAYLAYLSPRTCRHAWGWSLRHQKIPLVVCNSQNLGAYVRHVVGSFCTPEKMPGKQDIIVKRFPISILRSCTVVSGWNYLKFNWDSFSAVIPGACTCLEDGDRAPKSRGQGAFTWKAGKNWRTGDVFCATGFRATRASTLSIPWIKEFQSNGVVFGHENDMVESSKPLLSHPSSETDIKVLNREH